MAMVLLTPKSFFAQYAWFSRGRSHIYIYIYVPQINAIIIFIGVVDHYRLMVCPHALYLSTVTYTTCILEKVARFLYNAHITVQR